MNILARIKRSIDAGDIRSSLAFLFPYIRTYWRSYCFLLFILVTDVFIIILFAWLMQHITDQAVQGNFDNLLKLFSIGLGSLLVSIFLDYFNTYFRTSTVSHVKKDLRIDMYHRFLSMPYASFSKNHSGKLLSNVTNDIDKINGAVGGVLLNLIRLPIMILSVFAYLIYLNWQLSMIFLLLAPFTLVCGLIFGKLMRDRNRTIHGKVEDLHITLNDSFAGNLVLRVFNLEQFFSRKYQKNSDELFDNELKEASMRSWFNSSANLAGTMSFFITLGLGAFLVSDGEITVGVLLAFVSLMQHLVYPLTDLAGEWGGFQRSIAAVERIKEAMDVPPEMDIGEVVDEDRALYQCIEFKNVDFQYQGCEKLFKDFSLTILAGKVTALVGPSGGGKSTLLHLLQRVYRAEKGDILFDGKSVESMSVSQQRSYFSYVPQETFLFSGTIEENIALGKPGASSREIIEAAQKANAHSFIVELSKGYDTQVGERGARLSGGQKQRIAIARAILRDAPILLLDEATSALDNESERLVQEALDRLMVGRTTIMIAHRLSTIQHADHIVVIDNGEIVEFGTHDDLIRSDNVYANLYQKKAVRLAR
ncbi:ABC transporter ATP-binding protein [Alkalihalobacillus sp. CinArs1]|uniref:ABC transporter ATP-binding protein n=1 Tax=Alkalihalobacillus sp. CinArs1 TaxID=2995314 RepID=UPI0022DE4EF7|nr:ABC transporter ATP-binding protein [Alkalihalobacillus sp. CinArs1]